MKHYEGDRNRINELLQIVSDCERQKNSCTASCQMGIINSTEADEEISMAQKRSQKAIKELVDTVHGRSIQKCSPTAIYPDGYFQTELEPTETEGGKKKRKIIKSKTEADLYNKLYRYYFGNASGYTVGKLFELALDQKIRCENPKDGTVVRYRSDYKRFITDELSGMDATAITEETLAEYTEKLVHSTTIKKQAFIGYKGLLNLIFRYAKQKQIISDNPVDGINSRVFLKSCDTTRAGVEEETFSKENIDRIRTELKRRRGLKRYQPCFGYEYAIRFAILTGMRAGELVALKWEDVSNESIHIHAQQISYHDEDGHIRFERVNYTKNEQGISNGGRYFPVTNEIAELLEEIRTKHENEHITSEYLFAHTNGSWLTASEYNKYLNKLCNKLGLTVTKNHAFRKSVNSYLESKGLQAADRAELLGHSVRTNLEHYTYRSRECVDKARALLNERSENTLAECKVTNSETKVTIPTIPFAKRKSPKHLSL